MQKELQHFEETEELRNQNRELETMAHHHLHMWKKSKEQRARLSDSYPPPSRGPRRHRTTTGYFDEDIGRQGH